MIENIILFFSIRQSFFKTSRLGVSVNGVYLGVEVASEGLGDLLDLEILGDAAEILGVDLFLAALHLHDLPTVREERGPEYPQGLIQACLVVVLLQTCQFFLVRLLVFLLLSLRVTLRFLEFIRHLPVPGDQEFHFSDLNPWFYLF